MRILWKFFVLVASVTLNIPCIVLGSPLGNFTGGPITLGYVSQTPTDFNKTFDRMTGPVNGSITSVAANNGTEASSDNEITTGVSQTPNFLWGTPLKKVSFYISGLYFPITTVLAIFGNTISISILRRGVLNSNSTVYLLALAVADLLFGIAFAPTISRSYTSVSSTLSFKTFDAHYVSYVLPFVNVFHTAAVWVTVSFTLERFFAVSFPMTAHKYSSKLRAHIAVTAAFLLGLGINGYRFFRRTVILKKDPITEETYYTYMLTDFGRNKDVESAFFWVYFVVSKGIPFPMLVVLNSIVVWNVWRARRNRSSLTSKNGILDDKSKFRENQITRMLIAIVTAFLLCNALAGWASLYVAINGTCSVSTEMDPWVFYLFTFGGTLINTNPLVNCILYTTYSGSMRAELLRLVCPKRRSCLKRSAKSQVVAKHVDPPSAQ